MENEREFLGLLVSEWSAIGTVAAVIVSLVIGFVGWRGSARTEEKLRTQALRAQASKVAAWQSGNPNSREGYALTVINNSDLPVYGVRAPDLTIFNTSTGVDDPVEFGTIPPSKERSVDIGHAFGDISNTWELFFTDANGTEWHRTAGGVLSLVPASGRTSTSAAGKRSLRSFAE